MSRDNLKWAGMVTQRNISSARDMIEVIQKHKDLTDDEAAALETADAYLTRAFAEMNIVGVDGATP